VPIRVQNNLLKYRIIISYQIKPIGVIEKLKVAISLVSILMINYSAKRKLQWEFLP